MVTLAASVGPDERIFTVSGDVSQAHPGLILAVDSEVIHLDAFDLEAFRAVPPRRISRYRWRVTRGAIGSEPASHASGVALVAVRPAVLPGSELVPPSPIVNGGGGGEHPNLATHVGLGLAAEHAHDHDHDGTYASEAHAHAGGDHPDLATHTGLGLAAAHAHPYSTDSHDHDAAYAASGHGHVHNHDGTYAAPHAHPYAADNHTHPGGGGEAFPVGSVFVSVVSTDPATLLGYGTWAAFGEGRFLLGVGGAFPNPEATGGADTHTHAAHTGVIDHTHGVTDPGHAHVENSNNATTGPLRGWGAADTSTNTSTATGYSTASTTTGISVDAPAGAVASLTHDSPSHLPPYITAYLWQRTA